MGVMIDLNRPEMQQLAPEVRAEVRRLAPSTIDNGSITTAKLADNAVTYAKILNGAVGGDKLATGGVVTRALANLAVTTAKIADRAVTRAKAGIGTVTARDLIGNDLEMDILPLSSVEYAALEASPSGPSPTTLYFIYEGA